MDIRDDMARKIFYAHNYTNMFNGEDLGFYDSMASRERDKAYRAADDILSSTYMKDIVETVRKSA